MPMTMEEFRSRCEALNKEFNTAAGEMDAEALAAFRRKLTWKYGVRFENSWTIRIRAAVSDVFCVESLQTWTRTTKGVFGRKARDTSRLTLTSPEIPDCFLTCTSCDVSRLGELRSGDTVRVNGVLEASVFLQRDGCRWKAVSFIRQPVIGGK